MTPLQQAANDLLNARAALMTLLSGRDGVHFASALPEVIDEAQDRVQEAVATLRTSLVNSLTPDRCTACKIEAEIGSEENPHPVPERFHTCAHQAITGATP